VADDNVDIIPKMPTPATIGLSPKASGLIRPKAMPEAAASFFKQHGNYPLRTYAARRVFMKNPVPTKLWGGGGDYQPTAR